MPLPRSRPLICLVTDRKRLDARWGTDSCARLVRQVNAAAHAGVDLVQVRERDLQGGALAQLVDRCLGAAAGSPAQIVVNDRLDVAIAAGAAGVHLRGDSFTARRVRDICPAGFLIGCSVHSEGDLADADAADYVIFGSVFASPSKGPGHAGAGLDRLAAIVARAPVPVLGIGGVTLDRMPDVARTGAAGVAAIGLFASAHASAKEMGQLVSAIRRRFP